MLQLRLGSLKLSLKHGLFFFELCELLLVRVAHLLQLELHISHLLRVYTSRGLALDFQLFLQGLASQLVLADLVLRDFLHPLRLLQGTPELFRLRLRGLQLILFLCVFFDKLLHVLLHLMQLTQKILELDVIGLPHLAHLLG